MIRYLRYLWHRLRQPEYADYISEGLGIECRAARSHNYWSGHLRCSKAFQRELLETLQPQSVAILGAGRLLDVDQQAFLESCKEIYLYDCDPGAGFAWNKFMQRANSKGVKVHLVQCELTGRIQRWTEVLKQKLKNTAPQDDETLAALLCELLGEIKSNIELPKVELILSLNLLSQIPIYWDERVKALLRNYAPHLVAKNDSLRDGPQTALRKMLALLQWEHCELLNAAEANYLAILVDTEFYFYRSDCAAWQVEPALYDLPIPLPLKGRQIREDTWLWHVAPQGIEEKEYGAIHKVLAQAFALH